MGEKIQSLNWLHLTPRHVIPLQGRPFQEEADAGVNGLLTIEVGTAEKATLPAASLATSIPKLVVFLSIHSSSCCWTPTTSPPRPAAAKRG